MTLTTHAATGILVTQWTNNPFLGFFVAILSHFVLDAIPHGDDFIYWRHVHNQKDSIALITGATDFFFLIILLLIILNFRSQNNDMMIIAATIGGILPDLLMTLHTKNKIKFKEYYHGFFQHCKRIYHSFLKAHYRFHMFCHNIMRTPIRFRTALSGQAIFIIWFIFYFLH